MQANTPPRRANAIYYLLRQLGGESGDWALLALGFITGALAFLWAGYLGNPHQANLLYREPWSLFGLFCLFMIVLEASILLDPHLPEKWKPSRRRVVVTLAVTVIWIAVVSAAHLIGGNRLASWLHQLLPDVPPLGAWLGSHQQVAFILANLICIAVLWLGVRFASYDRDAATLAHHIGFRGERFAGDLVLSACFSIMLAWLFFAPFWQDSVALAATGHQQGGAQVAATVCDLTFLPFRAPCALSPFDFTTIFFLDLIILPLLYAVIALIILGLAAWHDALERGKAEEFPMAFLEVLRDVISRRLTLPNLLLALRFTWPLLLLLATVLVGVASKAGAAYLYTVAMASKGQIFWLDRSWSALALQFGAVAAVVVAMIATVSAATLQIFPRAHGIASLRRELAFIWRHVRFLALMLAVSYWLFSVIFSIINGLALIGVREYEIVTGIVLSDWHWAPFIQPDPLMLLSLAVFMFFAARRPRRRTVVTTTGKGVDST